MKMSNTRATCTGVFPPVINTCQMCCSFEIDIPPFHLFWNDSNWELTGAVETPDFLSLFSFDVFRVDLTVKPSSEESDADNTRCLVTGAAVFVLMAVMAYISVWQRWPAHCSPRFERLSKEEWEKCCWNILISGGIWCRRLDTVPEGKWEKTSVNNEVKVSWGEAYHWCQSHVCAQLLLWNVIGVSFFLFVFNKTA